MTGVIRAVFVVYALALATATHWPQLQIDAGPVPRPDLWIHVGAFAVWAVLINLADPYGWGWRDRRAQVAMLSYALAYAWVDEGTQAIPSLGRTFDAADLAANSAGCFLGAAAVFTVSSWPGAGSRSSSRLAPSA